MAYATVEQLSHVLNLTPRRINQLVKDEGMPRVSRGEYELVKCVQWYIRYLRDQLEASRRGTETEAQARLRLIQLTAELRRIDIAERLFELVKVDDVKEALTPIVSVMRKRLLAVPKKAAQLVSGKTSYEYIEGLFDGYIREVLIDLSTLPRQLDSIEGKKRKARIAGRRGSTEAFVGVTNIDLGYRARKKMKLERKRKRVVSKRKEVKKEMAAAASSQPETSEPEAN